jgi:hypothetical protein
MAWVIEQKGKNKKGKKGKEKKASAPTKVDGPLSRIEGSRHMAFMYTVPIEKKGKTKIKKGERTDYLNHIEGSLHMALCSSNKKEDSARTIFNSAALPD